MSEEGKEIKDLKPTLLKYVLRHDDIEFNDLIGVGAFGDVFIGKFIPTSSVVAIKRMKGVDINSRNLEIFLKEIEVMAEIKHKFLINFVGFTKTPPFCILTDYVPNDSLYEALRGDKKKLKLNATELSIIAYGIASGMEYLHKKPIIHRDLKTQNILLDEDKLPVICDFGSSRKSDIGQTADLGTPCYMAPEYISAQNYSEKVDVYSFGMVLWEMLTKTTPFDGLESAQVVFSVVIKCERPNIPEDAPKPIRKLIERCWAQEPEERPSFNKIKMKFKNGKVSFPGSNYRLFLNAVSVFSSAKLKRNERKLRMSGTYSNTSLNRTKTADIFHLGNAKVTTTNFTSQAASNVIGLASKDINLVKSSLYFFDKFRDEGAIRSIKIWTNLLRLLNSTHPLEQISLAYDLALYFAQDHDVLKSMQSVEKLEEYISQFTLDIFLYVVAYFPSYLNENCVNKFLQLSKDQSCSEHAITLLCNMLNKELFVTQIMRYFVQNAVSYSNYLGGHLILQTLINTNQVTDEMIISYFKSDIEANVIAAYQALYSLDRSYYMFTLDYVCNHIMSPSEDLRFESCEFIRKYGSGTIAQEPLNLIIYSLIQSILNYKSEPALLLLSRITNDPEKSKEVMKPGVLEVWLKCSVEAAPLFMKIFLLLFNHDNVFARYLMKQPDTAGFLANVLRSNDPISHVTVAWIIERFEIIDVHAISLNQEGVISLICNEILHKPDTPILKRYLAALNKVGKLVYVSTYAQIIQLLLNMISNYSELALHCIICLSSLSEQPMTHQYFMEYNFTAVLNRYKDSGESNKYKLMIRNNLKANGILLP